MAQIPAPFNTSNSFSLWVQAQRRAGTPDSTGMANEIKRLHEGNPVLQLSAEEFHQMLRLSVACWAHVEGRLRTKTHLHMVAALKVLDGEMTLEEFQASCQLWDWDVLARLDMNPLAMCCYQRVGHDFGAASATV
jgi:hypothetical protein